MKRLTQVALVGVLVLAIASLAAAQGTMQIPAGTPQPALRLGNFIEIGNDVFMHIIATNDFRYQTTTNFDFDSNVRDRAVNRGVTSSVPQGGESDVFWMLSRFGVDFRYQKSTEVQIVLEQRTNLDGNTTDDRFNSTNPGGVDVFGRAAISENKGYHCKYCWLDYKFEGTPLRIRVGYDNWSVDQAGLIGDNDPRFAAFGDFGDIDVMAAAVYQSESQRLGLTNDNDLLYYTFSVGYDLKPHRFQLDVSYTRDRFSGADTLAGGNTSDGAFRGQKNDSVLVIASWGGRVGPVRALVQGMGMFGHAKGANAAGIALGDLVGVRGPDRDYDILAGGAIAYAEVDLGIVRPFVAVVYGTPDGDPTDHKLHGFAPQPFNSTTDHTGNSWFSHLDTSNSFSTRDYACPARFQGLGVANVNAPGVVGTANSPGAVGITGRPATQATAIPSFSTNNPREVRAGHKIPTPRASGSHRGDRRAMALSSAVTTSAPPSMKALAIPAISGSFSAFSNPGTLQIPAGVRVFPMKGYEINGWYIYRMMLDTALLEAAFAPEIQARRSAGIRNGMYQEIGGSVLWTLNPNFDIRLAGNIAVPLGGYIDLAHLANCNSPGGGGGYATSARCGGNDPALRGEVRFRARF